MAIDSVPALIAAIKHNKVLEGNQLKDLDALQAHHTDPRMMIRELVQRELLTPFQANLVNQGNAANLVLGPYLLLARISDGALGQVYKARHRRMNRLVSLKVIRPELLVRPEAVEKFYEETQIISQLSDPHLVHAYDAGPVGQTHFFAMEYVEGIDLEALVPQAGPLPLEVAADFVLQTAQGLQHAYERGLTHGDLKPANLIVTRTLSQVAGSPSASAKSILSAAAGGGALVKINNLGLAFLQAPGTEATLATQVSPDYVAPERCQGNKGDIRSDLYSLGCVWYFLLTARVLFPGGTPAEKMRRHVAEEPVPLLQIRKDLPTGTVVMLGTLLAKRPEQRCQTPAELSQALAAGRWR
jgi:eukaryotic-like serine/threonine-protein kinase